MFMVKIYLYFVTMNLYNHTHWEKSPKKQSVGVYF